ncbi:MAG: hypothetical protein V4546_05510 [Bacteroidota bacterium]
MTGIRSLADELREKIRSQDTESTAAPPAPKTEKPSGAKKPASPKTSEDIIVFFTAIEAYQLSGSEKMLIRLDTRTTNLLKQLKLAKGIDMNKFIAFSLQTFLEQHPWLSPYIKETLKNTDL